MAKTVFILNGPNLNMLGRREPGIYGALTLEAIEKMCAEKAAVLGLEPEFRQSNHEGDLVDWVQEAGDKAVGAIINPGAYGHTSIALHDAVRAVDPLPVIEVHISNIHAREPFRHRSMLAPAATGMICGLGTIGYVLALDALAARLQG
ncbi:type II 3-dehydroquinate dehydratase [Nitratireductor indicus]|uniref:type II 3-dehydroquinate dehydratase n=1 Tax=Nitratireductor indicus TaxID=721133 RepID=UPI00287489B6|nr:type II 3-dehydroquinate dehydratase [Nitratireductor indicus]MDS1134929.1 type II 3-dehydroquinate dehydratase [Nitratireductor indicus]